MVQSILNISKAQLKNSINREFVLGDEPLVIDQLVCKDASCNNQKGQPVCQSIAREPSSETFSSEYKCLCHLEHRVY